MDPEDIGGIRLDDIFTGFGNMLLTICILMILVNILLLVSSTTKQPYISLPWIIANFIFYFGFILLVRFQKIWTGSFLSNFLFFIFLYFIIHISCKIWIFFEIVGGLLSKSSFLAGFLEIGDWASAGCYWHLSLKNVF